MTSHSAESVSLDTASDVLYRVCPSCRGTGRGPKNIGTWCEKCRRYEHGYVPKCGECDGGCFVRAAEGRLTLEQVLPYLRSDDLRDLGPEALVRRAFEETRA